MTRTAAPHGTPRQRQLRDFGAGAVLAIIIATVAFVAVRNKELARRQIDAASRAVVTMFADFPPPSGASAPAPAVRTALVSAATRSTKHPYLRRRTITEPGMPTRPLGGANAPPEDKLFFDAATRFEHSPKRALDELLGDGSGRAVVARSTCAPRPGPATCDIAIAITGPAAPAPFPFLIIVGILGLCGAIALVGASINRSMSLACLFTGIAGLAIPTVVWHAYIATGLILAVAVAITIAHRARWTDRLSAAYAEHRVAYNFVTPAAVAMFLLVAAPFVIGILMGFYDHHQGTWSAVGLDNFVEILSGGGRPIDDPLNFWFIFAVTIAWTLANLVFSVAIGVALALVLSRHWLWGRGFFRMLFILPWAIPNYITALIWNGMFKGEYGAINMLLHECGLSGVSWFSSWATAFSANVITNVWLGFPFMMVVALGALETIPRELYEAAEVDGANARQRFWHITLPHLRPALGPAVALSSIWTFNMFNVIYLVSGGKPNNSTNILVTDAYRWAFERGERYGMAAAYGTVIFSILLAWNLLGGKLVRRKAAA
jgi:ABC-type sugar transport system permease subunit